MKDIVIIGSGGFAKEVRFLIDLINRKSPQFNFLGYIDNELTGAEVIGNDDFLKSYEKELAVAIGIGNPNIIKKVTLSLTQNKNLTYPNLIAPNAIGDWSKINLGEGNVICSGNIFTTAIKIGSFNIFNLNCTLGHDALIEDYNVINPGVNISGGVKIGSSNLLGTSSTVLQYLNLADDIIVGAGAVVTKNLIESGVYVGMPAKKRN